MKKMRQALALLLSVAMLTALTACGGGKDGGSADDSNAGDSGNTEQSGGAEEDSDAQDGGDEVQATGTYDTLVIGTGDFEGVFSPYFYSSTYDNQVNDLIFATVSRLNKDGEVVDDAGHVEVEEVKAEDGTTKYVYTVSIQEGMKFSDGEDVTIDDVIFSYYVFADPTYDGMSTFNTLDIEGLADYVNAQKPLWEAISAAGQENTDFSHWTEDQQKAFWEAVPAAGASFAQEIVDYLVASGDVEEGDIAAAAGAWGFEVEAGATAEDFFNAMVAKYENDLVALSGTETAGSSLVDFMDASFAEMVELASVDTITGIQKVDDYTCTVTFNTPNISGDKQVAWLPIVPEHYYGADFSKGHLEGVKEKNSAPMGSGPYVFENYDNKIVSLKANPDYFKGAPKIPNVKLQYVADEAKVDTLLNGDIDITDPPASLEIVDEIEASPDKASYNLVDFAGYGYIGINAERVPDQNVRKGLMHLMNRAPAVSSYYGELAHVIERPMTPTLAEYPDDAKEYYGYDPAKALEYFKAAGYEEKDGKLMKDGEQLVIEIGIGELSTHPAKAILTQMVSDMQSMGAELVVQDMQFSNLSPAVTGGDLDMWVMAWGNSTDCDQTQMFGSKGGSNYQRYYSDELDAVLEQIKLTVDFDERCKLVEQSLDMIMDAAVYMPIYQRSDMEVYNAATLNLDTLPEETTSYYNYVHEIETLEMQ